MKENVSPTVLIKKDFLQINECNCGKNPFRYHDASKNIYVAKCPFVKEEFEIKTKKWIASKKQPCEFYCVYYGERPVFEEIKQTLIIKAQKNPDKNLVLEEKLRLLFRFVFVSNHTATLDEINILVKNSLRREPRKVYYYPSPGHMRISHYESLEDYRDRIFSKKIVDLSHIVKLPEPKPPLIQYVDLEKMFNIKPKVVKHPQKIKQVKTVKSDPIAVSNFIDFSDDGISETNSELSREESDYELDDQEDIEDTEEIEETEEIVDPEEEIDEPQTEYFDDYDDSGDDAYD